MVIHAKLFLLFCAVKYVKFGMGQPQLHKIAWYILSKKHIEFATFFIYYKQYKYPEFRNRIYPISTSQILLRLAAPLPFRGRTPTRTEAFLSPLFLRNAACHISGYGAGLLFLLSNLPVPAHRSGSGDEI